MSSLDDLPLGTKALSGLHGTLAVGWAICTTAVIGRILGITPELASFILAGGLLLTTRGLIQLLLRGDYHPARIIPTLTIIWYCFPVIYCDFVDPALIPRSNPDELWLLALGVLSISATGYALSFFVQFPRIQYTPLPRQAQPRWYFFLAIVSLIQMYFMFTGTWTYGSLLLYANREPSLLVLLIGFYFRPIIALLAFCVASSIRHGTLRAQQIPVILLIGLTQMLWLTIDGRRNLALMIAVAIVIFVGTLNLAKKLSLRRTLILLVSLTATLFLIYFSWSTYFSLRQNHGNSQTTSDVGNAIDLLNSQGAIGVDAAFAENLVSRPLSLMQSLAVAEQTRTGYLLGEGLVQAAQSSIPAAVWPDKSQLVAPTIEALWASRIGVPLNDWSATVLLSSLMDFGYPGFLIYLSVLIFLLRASLWISRRTEGKFFFVFVSTSMLFTMFSVEQTFSEYFLVLRNIAILWVPYVLLLLFSRPLLRRPGDRLAASAAAFPSPAKSRS